MNAYPPLTHSLAVATKCEFLYRKYVGAGAVNLSRLSNEIARETVAAENGWIRVSRDLLRELRADRNWIRRLEGAKVQS